MKRRTTIRAGLLAIATTVLILTSVAAEKPESSVSPSQPPRESEVPSQQTFIELSRTKKHPTSRRRPPPRRFRTSTTSPSETSTLTFESSQPSTTAEAALASTAAKANQSPEIISTTPSSPVEQNPQQAKTGKEVQFTGLRRAKSNRGRVSTFPFKNPQDKRLNEAEATQSRIPAGFSPVFTPRKRARVPQTSSATNQPNYNLAINSGPPGDVPRARPTASVAGHNNHISQSQDLEEKTAPVNIDEAEKRPVKFLPPSIKPKSKTRPYKGPDIPVNPRRPTQPLRESQLKAQNLTPDSSSSATPRPNRPIQEGPQTELSVNPGTTEELSPKPSSESADRSHTVDGNGAQGLSTGLPAPPRIRYVKAGSMRFLPNRPATPQDVSPEPARSLGDPPLQTLKGNEGQEPAARDNLPESPRPNKRPGTLRYLPNGPASTENLPPEPTRNFVDPNTPNFISNEGQDQSERENSQAPVRPNRPLKTESFEFLPNTQANRQEIPPELVRDFANLQTLIANGENRTQFSSSSPPRPNRPLNPKTLRFLPNTPTYQDDLPPELRRDFAGPALQTLIENEGQDRSPHSLQERPRPKRPLNEGKIRVISNDPQGLLPQSAGVIADPNLQTLIENEKQGPVRPEPSQPNRPLNTGALEVLPNDPQWSPPQSTRDFVRPTLERLIESDGQGPMRFNSQELPRPNRPLEPQRFSPTVAQGSPPQSARDFADPNLQTLLENQGQGPVRPESSQPNRPLNAGALRIFLNGPQGSPPQSARDIVDPSLETLIESEGQGPVRFNSPELPRPNRPFNVESQRFSPNGAQRLPLQSARDFADPNLQILIENERQGPVRPGPSRPNRPLNAGALRFSPNGPQGSPPQSARDIVDPSLETLIESEGQDPVRYNSQEVPRPNRPFNVESQRFSPNGAHGLPPQLARDFADPNLQTLVENERQGQVRQEPQRPNRPSSAGQLRFLPKDPQGLSPQQLRNNEAYSGDHTTLTASDTTDLNLENVLVNGRVVHHYSAQVAERLPSPTLDSSVRQRPANSELEINSQSNSPEHYSPSPNDERQSSARAEANQQAGHVMNPQTNALRSIEQPSSPTARGQPSSQTVPSSPGLSINPSSNIPRLIIEFPSSSSSGDQSIRLQLNPNSQQTLPTSTGSTINRQPDSPRITSEVPSSPALADTFNDQLNQQAPPANAGAGNNPQSTTPKHPAQLPLPTVTLAADPSLPVQSNQQALPANAGPVIHNTRRQQAELPATYKNFRLNQQTFKNAGLALNSQSNITQTSSQTSKPSTEASLRVQPDSQDLRANLGPVVSQPPSAPEIPAQLPTMSRNPSTNLQPMSQNLPPISQIALNPLSKTRAFSNQLQSPVTPTLRDPLTRIESNVQVLSSNVGQALNSVSNSRPVQQLLPVTRDSVTGQQLNSQALPNLGSAANLQASSPPLANVIPATPSLVDRESSARSQPGLQSMTAMSEAAVHASSNSTVQTAESKPPAGDAPVKPNVNVPPVDLRLTINFNSNIPGFSSQQLQPTSNTPQTASSNTAPSNNTQLNIPTHTQEQPPPTPPNTSSSPNRSQSTNQQLRPSNVPIISFSNSFPTSTHFPIDQLFPVINNSPLRSQSEFQTPANFGSTFNSQFNARGFPIASSDAQDSSIRSQLFSQFLNANIGPVNSQFSDPGRFLDLHSPQSQHSLTTHDQFDRFKQNSQFLPSNGEPAINSQYKIPGRPFEIQSQRPPTQDFLARFQPNSQFIPANAGSAVNAQSNSFNQLPSPSQQPPSTQNFNSPRPSPKVFTANAGLAVNSLSYSPGLSVELLPPTSSDSSSTGLRTKQEFSTTNEPPVNFLVNSPELSAELLPPVVSEQSISTQSPIPQPVQPPSPQTPLSSINFQSKPQFSLPNTGQVSNFPVPSIELLPPLDPFFPQFSQNPNVGFPPNPIDIPKPPVPALVPPPREKLTIPIDIPKPAVPALVPPPREHTEIPIDIPRPDVPALVPPPRSSDRAAAARLVPPTPTTFAFNPSSASRIFQEEIAPNPSSRAIPIQTNLQAHQSVRTSPDNPVLILPKSNYRQQSARTRPKLEDTSIRVGFLPQNSPAPFSAPTQLPSHTQADSLFQITDVRAGRVQPIVQEVLTAKTPAQLPPKIDVAVPQITFLRSPVSQELQPPLLSPARPNSQQIAFDSIFSINQTNDKLVQINQTNDKLVQSNRGQSSVSQRLTSTVQPPTQTLLPPAGQQFTLAPRADAPPTISSQSPFTPTNLPFSTISAQTSSETQTVNIVSPKKEAESPTSETTSTSQSLRTLSQPPPEGFVIFQTPTITITSQSNQPDSPINITVVTQGGTGFIKPNTTLTAEPVRPVNQPLSAEQQPFVSTPGGTLKSSSTLPDQTGNPLNSLNQRILPDPLSSTANLSPLRDTGFTRNNFSSNPFAPPFSQSPISPLSSPFRSFNLSTVAHHGAGTPCPKLNLQHKGHKAPQFGTNLILSPGFYPIDDPAPTRCDTKRGIQGKQFNWWQILLNNGGEPSTLSRANESEDVKIPPLKNPCVRPFETQGVPVFYNITKTDSQTYYREEIAYHRFPESKNTFLESRGLFVWRSSFDSTAFLVLYTRDDSGFWLQIKDVTCTFYKNGQPNLQCRSVPECFCNGSQKRCTESVPLLTRNFSV